MSDTNYWKVMCVLFCVLTVILGVYMLDDVYRENNIKLFQEGYVNGSQDTALVLFERAVKCEPITLSNQTVGVNLIAAECLPPEVIEYLQGRQENG